ncbi:MAG: response regulator [Chloroflexota bacterium]
MSTPARARTTARAGTRPAQLVIADDHDLARAGLRSILQGEPGLEIVAEAADGRSALATCRRIQPDLILLDLRMPDLDGLAVARALRRHCPRTRIIMVTMYENPEYVREAVRAGVSGYVLKYSTQQEVVGAVRSALAGNSIASAAIVETLERGLPQAAAGDWPRERLTPREHEVLRLLSRGLTNKDIAEALTISRSTVKIHVEHIIAKLEVADRTEAAVRAAEYGLLQSAGPMLQGNAIS